MNSQSKLTQNKKLRITSGIVLFLVVAISGFAYTQKVSPLSWGWWGPVNVDEGVAIGGYDPVAYFRSGTPVKGESKHQVSNNGVSWYFSSEENKKLFELTPAKYQPQYGGFCAFATSKGFTAVSSPEAWHIEQNKLYLFNDKNVRETWISEISDGVIAQSDKNWKTH
ncbi:YHS domain-containing (seleno)protein [Aliikangiella coralliicola]|uniref:YHS domain-containing protein n=1 Tax=Aliikangiella coralliicola TaxID=2592383 RepID=A0A545U6I0_9GAMM|nr:YHS domain-containing (seleno)protein [Aliikangiella coralliicola]TQV85079.1 YHS domain-containing protein [Aliikangiella coralliicola]